MLYNAPTEIGEGRETAQMPDIETAIAEYERRDVARISLWNDRFSACFSWTALFLCLVWWQPVHTTFNGNEMNIRQPAPCRQNVQSWKLVSF